MWCGLGLAGLYRPASAAVALAIGLALAAGVARGRGATPSPVRADAGHGSLAAIAVPVVLVAIPIALALPAALAPPTAKDTLQYHLALPAAFLAAGSLADVPGNLANYFALGAEMHGLWAMLLGRAVSQRAGEAAFGAVAFAFFPVLLAAVFGWARERGVPREWAWLAAALVAGVPAAVEVAGSGYVDVALALYVALAVEAAARWWVQLDRESLIHCSLALGFALSVKLTAAFGALFVLLVVVLRAARRAPAPRAVLAKGLGALVAAAVIGSPWYIRTWVRTGSPVFPFLADLWPGDAPDWDARRSALLEQFNALYGGADKTPVDYLFAPLRLSLAGQREIPSAFEGVLGAGFLVAAALVLWALARRSLDRELRVAAAGSAVLFACWLFSAQVLRYLLPALPPLAVAAAGAGAALARAGAPARALYWSATAAVAAAELLAVAWFAADNPLLAATGAEPRAAYLERRLDYYPYYELINRSLPADVRIWLVDMRRDVYHLARPYVGDYLFEDYTLRRWIEEAKTGREVRERARAAGITHVLVRHDVLFDYARSPLVDDRLPREENVARLERLRSFLAEEAKALRADGKFALVALAPAF